MITPSDPIIIMNDGTITMSDPIVIKSDRRNTPSVRRISPSDPIVIKSDHMNTPGDRTNTPGDPMVIASDRTNTPRDPMSAADDQICNRSDPKGFRRIGGAPVQAEIGEKGVGRSTRVHESGRNSDSVTPAWANDVRMDCKAASHSDGTSGTGGAPTREWPHGARAVIRNRCPCRNGGQGV